jgi:hypothetical protein
MPSDMLRARCSSALARAVYPDAVGGLYNSDELPEVVQAAPSTRVAQKVSTALAAPVRRDTVEVAPASIDAVLVDDVAVDSKSSVDLRSNDDAGTVTLGAKIRACEDLMKLKALSSELSSAPDADKTQLRELYRKRREELGGEDPRKAKTKSAKVAEKQDVSFNPETGEIAEGDPAQFGWS